jgi:hypothetical protein
MRNLKNSAGPGISYSQTARFSFEQRKTMFSLERIAFDADARLDGSDHLRWYPVHAGGEPRFVPCGSVAVNDPLLNRLVDERHRSR